MGVACTRASWKQGRPRSVSLTHITRQAFLTHFTDVGAESRLAPCVPPPGGDVPAGSKVPSPPGAQSTRSPLGTGGGSPAQAPLPLVSSKETLGGAGPKHPRLSPGSGHEPPGATGELHPAARQGPQPGAQRPAPPTTLLGKVAPGSLLAVTQPIPSPWQDRGPQRQLSPQS